MVISGTTDSFATHKPRVGTVSIRINPFNTGRRLTIAESGAVPQSVEGRAAVVVPLWPRATDATPRTLTQTVANASHRRRTPRDHASRSVIARDPCIVISMIRRRCTESAAAT